MDRFVSYSPHGKGSSFTIGIGTTISVDAASTLIPLSGDISLEKGKTYRYGGSFSDYLDLF